MNNSRKIIFIIAAMIITIANINYVSAQEESFLGTIEIGGFAEVRDNNQAVAKEQAIKDAIRRAVEKTVESTLPPELLLDNYSSISTIYSNSAEYIHSYSFLSESFNSETNIYSVTLSITLYPQYINSQIASRDILNDVRDKSQNVLIIIRERGLTPSNEDDFWGKIPASESFFTKKMESQGIVVIGRDTLQDKVDIALIQKSLQGDAQAAIQIGLLSSAKIVITGNAVARERGNDPENPSMIKYQANISLKAYQTKTGKILGARSEFVTILNDDPELGELNAFIAAGEKIYNSFINDIINKGEDA